MVTVLMWPVPATRYWCIVLSFNFPACDNIYMYSKKQINVVNVFVLLSLSTLLFISCGHQIPSPSLNDYTGHYGVTPKYTITISQRSGHLYYKPTGQSVGDLLLRHSPGVYYLEEWEGNKIRFSRDENGQVDALVIEKKNSNRRCPRAVSPVEIKAVPVADQFIPVEPVHFPKANENPLLQTLESIKNNGSFYTMSYFADYSDIVKKADSWEYRQENRNHIRRSIKCSVFYNSENPDQPFLGRNFDNIKCDVVVGFYRPKNGFASIALTRLSDLGYKTGTDITALDVSERTGLLAAPFFVADGINERGLAVGIASVKKQNVIIDKNKESIHISAFCRYLLDYAGDVEQVIEMVSRYNIYDEKEGGYTVAHHLLVGDPSGNSAILECVNGRFEALPSKQGRQMVTNSPLINVPEPTRRMHCGRYDRLSNIFNDKKQKKNWHWAMSTLRAISLTGNPGISCWSSGYDLKRQHLYLVVKAQYNRVYQLVFPETDIQ
jgi:hypothetical protein